MIEYSENTFAIELISDFYGTRNPGYIKDRAKEDLEIELTLSEILDYLGLVSDLEKEHMKIEQNFNLKQEEYEFNKNNLS